MSKKEEELRALQKISKKAHDGRINKDSKDRLKKIASKKCSTCFISALHEFESAFGKELWGHDSPQEQLTDRQKSNKAIWEQVRKNILDKGNKQSRALNMEIDLHDIRFEGYNMQFGGNYDV